MIGRFEKFSFAISEISRYWHKIAADEMDKYGLKGPYAVYFTTMYQYADGLTASQLCELCGRDKSDVSRAIAVMEKKGLVKKESVNQKLYRARLTLTPEGRIAAEHINERAKLAVEFGGKGLSDEHREIFYNALDKISSNLHTLSEDGIPS
ncbi:MAG: winged helix-turn-helix transcriptional regulator [Clostridia bacterium]|nr:winged helix-turn-helix transcriptional regulator [Oscillospiraceae bacterium]MBQ6796848.1 winged helix-turn-helix transcriptional regulator [Clostridia bacterium]